MLHEPMIGDEPPQPMTRMSRTIRVDEVVGNTASDALFGPPLAQ